MVLAQHISIFLPFISDLAPTSVLSDLITSRHFQHLHFTHGINMHLSDHLCSVLTSPIREASKRKAYITRTNAQNVFYTKSKNTLCVTFAE